jgi:hypothetical protein
MSCGGLTRDCGKVYEVFHAAVNMRFIDVNR